MTEETSAGFLCIRFATEVLGFDLLPWQRWLLIHALELLEDGTFRFRTVLVLVARQNGKSTLAQVLALFFMYVRAANLVIGTAQNLDIAEEVWQGAVDIAQGVDELAEQIDRVVMVNGKKSLELISGERYKVQTANRRGGRGLSGDLVILDELREHQTWDSWSAVTKTTLARPLAQVWALSNAGDHSSVVLTHLRERAHLSVGDPDNLSGETPQTSDGGTVGIFEWSAAPDTDLWDRDGWAQANPSLTVGPMTERALADAAATDPPWVFRTEVMCQWVDSTRRVIPLAAWLACADANVPRPSPVTIGVDVRPDRGSAAVAVCGTLEDGRRLVEIVEHRDGTDWIRATVLKLRELWDVDAVVIDKIGPAASLIAELEQAGVEITLLSMQDMARACGLFFDAVMQRTLVHCDDEALNVSLSGAEKRELAASWAWSRKTRTDASPLVAATAAHWKVSTAVAIDPAANIW